MLDDDALKDARALIQAGEYDEAEKLLKTIPGTKAQEWLHKVRELKATQTKKPIRSIIPDSPIMSSYSQSITRPKTKRDIDVVVTTADLHTPYTVIGPIMFQISNKGIFSSALSKFKKLYSAEITEMRSKGTMSANSADWFGVFFEGSVGQNDFESAFLIGVRELQKRAHILGGDAIVGMRQDIDLDTNGFQFFYLQMYGTVVRFNP